MDEDRVRRVQAEIADLSRQGLDWMTFASAVTDAVRRVVPFDRSCWHTVDPGTVLFTGNLSQNVACSGSWLAHYEYVVEDVNKWWFLARSGRRVGATSLATHGDLSRSARYRSQAAYDIGDELRGSFVADGVYWAAAGFLRDRERPWFTEQDVRLLTSLSDPIADGFRRALVTGAVPADAQPAGTGTGPGVVVLDEQGEVEFISPAAERWIAQLMEEPPPATPGDSKMVQMVAARARTLVPGGDPLELAARARVLTRSGSWLLLYGTRLAGGAGDRIAVIIQPATPSEVAPLVALAYGLTERECQVTHLCLQGLSTKQMARALHVSPYTVQDHLKSIFAKTGVRTRSELVGQVFLEHYVPRWEEATEAPSGWLATSAPPS